ncbi:peptidyl-prolyl cis-trans isomerase A (cyclophilin A) [Novosphingobium fluoreni]|uniref:peptidylprolyl isomerase n=1 Tax=Novosphingobium fluoreni TaxID=1391222 RepID=A0A7W6C022_9SPHN|nr:peptidylprolyl isomerase [Novosphingobium fluoreni]MBB3939650.1 peptidyl-prolyl cis-trans isomerase A (cyclophilin A) [Novosphingobium fluoreni]
MIKRFAFSAPILMLLAAASPAPQGSSPADVYVTVQTSAGTITLDLDAAHAPLTTGNFLKYVDGKRFDGTAFYRAMHLEWGTPPNGLIQGGTQNDPKRILKPVAHEPTSQTGILHKRGTISMARFAPGTATGDFSIMLSDQPGLDAKPDAPDADAKAGFAAFGQVVSGMDVVEKIFGMPRSVTKGVGVMKGQMLDPPVRIISMKRVAAPPAPPAAPAVAPPFAVPAIP